jgi:hypothetical protein
MTFPSAAGRTFLGQGQPHANVPVYRNNRSETIEVTPISRVTVL